MDFRFTDEQQLWYDTLQAFMEKDVGREYTREHDESREFPYEAYKKIADNGWLGILIPEEYGGMAADARGLHPPPPPDAVMFAIFCESMAKFSLDTAACVMTGMFTATNICNHGTPEQKAKYLPGFLAGDVRFSISITEPDAGSDAAGLKTKAELDGEEWIINGNKVFSSGAHLPGNVIALLARTGSDKHAGISLILVPNDAPGVELRKMGTIVRKSFGTTEIFLTDVRVPRENLIGEVNRGWEYLREHLEMERLSLAASYVGNARTALDDALRYSQQRHQFGKPLSKFQVLRHRLAEDATAVEAARLLMYNAATKIARGERALKEVSMAKVFAADVAFKVAFNGMQLLGGYAQLPEYDMERYFREAKHAMVGGGTNEIQKGIIAKELGL
jgi:alkylation response protein AidB-like acyl-CoA dehydrogenase